jgi:ubiquinone/menaquinone biosynthesis C-methylase UbiE
VNRPVSALSFRVHLAYFRLRDRFVSPESVLAPVGLKPGDRVLDYGCGGGSYSLAAARLVGPGGRVWAVDFSPLAVAEVRRRARERGLANLEVLGTSCATGLPDQSVDVALLYDVYQALGDPAGVLTELRRVLRPGGQLSVRHHHARPGAVRAGVEASGLFRHTGTRGGTMTFRT